MFGGGFGQQTPGAFGQPQQPQQQQQPGAFGQQQTPGFGFGQQQQPGAAPAFGQPQQQQGAFGQQAPGGLFGQQPAQTPGFGAPGGGLFGQQSQQQQQQQQAPGSSAFGAPAASATGFGSAPGGFGVTSSGFGAPAATSGFGAPTGAFGAAPSTTNAFGAASTGFGAPTTTGAFGGGMQQQQQQTSQTLNQGTGNPSYAPTQDKDSGALLSAMSIFHCISAMPAYKNWSFEELRAQDYSMNKKFAGSGSGATAFGASTVGTGAFGQAPAMGGGMGGFGATQPTTGFGQPTSSPFGAPATVGTTAPSAFGATPGFGQQAPAPSTGLFSAAPTTGFGAPASTGAFGAPAPAGGLFGQPAAATTTSGFGFGVKPAAAAAPAWGAPATTTPSLFGAPAATSAPAFGQQQPATQGGLFGQKPAAPSTGGFGFGQQPGQTPGGLFGAPANTQQPATGLFGAPAAAPAAGGLFGAPKPATGGFSFGAPAAASATPGGLFGAPAATQPQMGGGLFGAPASTMGGGLFGTPATSAPAPGGLFGAATSAPSLGMTPAPGGLFGAAPKAGGLFGAPSATPATAGFGFGATAPTATTMGGGLFGMPQQTPSSTLGAGGLFGASMATPLGGVSATPGATLTAAIDKNPYGVNPLFTPSGKTATTVAQASIEPTIIPPRPTDSKKPIMTPHFKVTPRSAAKIKLRGFAGGSPAVVSTSFSDTKNNLKLASHTPGLAGPAQARQPPTPSGLDARFTPRKTMTKLILSETPDTQVHSFISEVKSRSQQQGSKEVTFDPSLEESALSVLHEARAVDVDQENVSSRSQLRKSGLNLGTPGSLNSSTMTSTVNTPFTPASSSDYQIEPTLSELLLLSDEELHAVEGFCVTLPQVGSIKFLKPVDLLTASRTGTRAGISQIPGCLIILEPKICTVYPDEDCKPPVGFGLNVTAEINLEKCWPVDKATRRPITDESDPRHDRHMRKLESMSETRWLGFHNPSGTWRFQVDHFSRYGLLDDEGSDSEAVVPTPDSRKAKATLVNGDESLTEDEEEFDNSTIKDSFAHVKAARLGHASPGSVEAEYEEELEEYDEEEWSGDENYEREEILLEQDEVMEADQDALSDSEITEQLDQTHHSTKSSRFASFVEERTITRHAQGMKASYFKQSESSIVPAKAGPASYFGDKPLQFMVPVSLDPTEPQSPGKRPDRDLSPESVPTFPESRKGFLSKRADENQEMVGTNGTAPSPRKYLKSFLDQRALKHIFFKDSVSYQKEGQLVDSGLLMGRSFRVAWGPDGSFFTVKSGSISQLEKKTVDIFNKSDEAAHALKHETCLKTVFEDISLSLITPISEDSDEEEIFETDAATEENFDRTPKANVSADFSFSKLLSLVETNQAFSLDDISLWKLASALWDEIPVSESLNNLDEKRTNYVTDATRELQFSEWLKWNLRNLLDSETPSSPIQRIWMHLAKRQIGEAVQEALGSKNLRLASILSQIGGTSSSVIVRRTGNSGTGMGHGIVGRSSTDVEVSHDVSMQVRVWKKGACDLLEPDVRKIWDLLTGDIDLWEPTIFADLKSWKQVFGVLFWYSDGGRLSINDSVKLYENLGQKGRLSSVIVKPKASYNMGMPSEFNDICFHLVKLFTEDSYTLEQSLQPETFSSNSLDYLNSWLMYQCFSKSKCVRDFLDAKEDLVHHAEMEMGESSLFVPSVVKSSCTGDRMTFSLIHQLERLGLWKWSVFVALFLTSNKERERVIKALLSTHYPLEDHSGSWFSGKLDSEAVYAFSEIWTFFMNLKIPSVWIHESRSLRARYARNVIQEVVSLVDAKHYDACHQQLINEVAPTSVLSGNFTFLKAVLEKLPATLLNWQLGGGLLLEYISIMSNVPSLIQEVELSQFHGPKIASQALQETWLPRLESFRDLLCSSKAQLEKVWQYSTVSEALMSRNALDLLAAAERLLQLQDSSVTKDIKLVHNDSMLLKSSLWFDQVVDSSV